MRIADPFDLEESLFWVIAASKSRKPRLHKDEKEIVREALERIYKKLEGKKVIINVVTDEDFT